MEALNASYRVMSGSVVVVLGVIALLATFINAVVAVSFMQTDAGWLTTYAVIYLVLALAVRPSPRTEVGAAGGLDSSL